MTMHTDGEYTLQQDPWGSVHKIANLPSGQPFTPPGWSAARLIEADAEVAKQLGGMIALYPRQDFAEAMAVQGGEPVEDLHLTLAYLGEDVTDLPKDYLVAAIAQLADSYTTAITARVFAHAIFNPDGGSGGDQDPCVVYLIGDCPELTPLRDQVIDTCQTHLPNMHDQHEPFTAHVTAAYAVQSLSFTGPIVFDRLCVDWAGEQIEFPLLEP